MKLKSIDIGHAIAGGERHSRGRVVRRSPAAFSCLAVFAAIAAFCLSGAEARAGVYTYASSAQSRTINCGILLADSAGQVGLNGQSLGAADLPSPYPFYILNLRTDIKPDGWQIVNPLAPSVVTSDLQVRYTGYTLGQPVTPNMAAYWQISLPTVATDYADGADVLSQFNLLVIHTHDLIGLSRDEREALRQYVDEGGTLWVEDCEGATTLGADLDAGTPTPAGLFMDVLFNDNAGAGGYAVVPDSNHRHPLTTIPYFLSQMELNDLGDKDVSNYFMSSMNGAGDEPDPVDLLTVIGNSAHLNGAATPEPQPYVAAGDYGAGHIVIDNADSIDDICNPVTNASSTGFCPADVQAAHSEDLKFLVNMLSWSSDTASNAGGNTRRNGVEPAPLVGAGLDPAWTYPDSRVNTVAGSNLTLNSWGAAISANIAYVTTQDTAGTAGTQQDLHAFDLIPQEDLNNDGDTDDGDFIAPNTFPVDQLTNIAFLGDWSHGLSYDELWIAKLGTAQLSAPTVATLPGGQYGNLGYFASVMVEADNGQVYIYDATCNPQNANPVPEATLPATVSKGTFSGSNALVPAPVYYRGWLIAAQPVDPTTGTASVFLYNFANGSDTDVALPPVSGGSADGSPIVGQIAVASIPSNDGAKGGEDIVAYVSTQQNVYALFLGSRDERLSASGGNSYSTKLSAMTGSEISSQVGLSPAPEDGYIEGANPAFVYMNANPTWSGGVPAESPQFRGATISGAPALQINVTADGGDQTTAYGDYDVTIPSGGGPYTVTRHQIVATIPNGPGAYIQGIAVGPDNVLYETVNEGAPLGSPSYIEATSEQNPGLAGPGTVIKWRFALVTAGPDADGISYQFAGFHFVGAPVVDGSYVYALASNGNFSDVLCFNRNPVISFTVNTSTSSNNTGLPSLSTITQTDENGATQTILANQYFETDNAILTITIKDFSPDSTGSPQITPDLCVPLPITASYVQSTQSSDSATQSGEFQLSTSGSGSPLLNWFYQLPTSGPSPSPMAEFGNSLYVASNAPSATGQNAVYAIDTTGIVTGQVAGNTRQLQPTAGSLTVSTTSLTCGQLNSAMVASGAYVLAAGTATANNVTGVISGGIEGAVYGLTMIADNNRLIEIDPAGNAVWSLDSTSEQMLVGAQAPTEQNPSTGATPAATVVSLSRPSSISELTADDILFADSGNSRCVRVDRSGRVLWELTAFQDPSGLLAPGQPLTLNHPSSVVEWREQYVDTNANPAIDYVIEHYLVADSGNYRVLEVDDTFTENSTGVLSPATETNSATGQVVTLFHVLHWVTHTGDQLGRQYRYVSAAPYTDANGNPGIVAAISNKQVAPLTTTVPGGSIPVLDTSSKDSTGSSIMVFALNSVTGGNDYSPTPNIDLTGAVTGTAYTPDVPLYAPGTTWPNTDSWAYAYNGLPDLLINQVEYTTSTAPVTTVALPLRDLRFITVYLPVGATNGQDNIMIADDDGVFDGPINELTVYGQVPPIGGGPSPALNPYAWFINATTTNTNAGFSFTAADYAAMIANAQTQLGQTATPYPENAFIPASAQHLDNGDYLITNGAAVGDARPWDPDIANNNAINNSQSGGCVFEVLPAFKDQSPVSLFGRQIPGSGSPATGPTNSSPLSQPAFAYRSQ